MHFDGLSSFTLLCRNATSYGITSFLRKVTFHKEVYCIIQMQMVHFNGHLIVFVKFVPGKKALIWLTVLSQ